MIPNQQSVYERTNIEFNFFNIKYYTVKCNSTITTITLKKYPLAALKMSPLIRKITSLDQNQWLAEHQILCFSPNLLKIQQAAICVLILSSSGQLG